MNELLGLAGFALVASGTPGPNNTLLLASGVRFGFRRTLRHVLGTALGMTALVLATAAGIGMVVLAVPGAELVLKLVGSAYLFYLAIKVASNQGSRHTVIAGPFGIWHAAGFQFVNPKAWLFGLVAVGTFVPPGLGPVAAAVTVAATCAVVILGTAAVWAAGGAALHRIVEGGRSQRAVSVALAVILAMSVALIWI